LTLQSKISQRSIPVCLQATSLYYLGKYDNALEECNKAIKLEYTFPDSYIWKAKILVEKGDIEEARKSCDEFWLLPRMLLFTI